ncbi:MAG: MBL fold metallo-hydrolase [Clostridia bacterium]|nr:MBL fold metallo-hydrolase [Clostridia bacterium]
MKSGLRRIRIAVSAFSVLICLIFSACSCGVLQSLIKSGDAPVFYDCFSVNFLDVGEGDAIFINFNDGKTMLIDCGEKDEKNLKTIERYLNAYSGGTLDYLILTHPDSDHVGNAAYILEKYAVKTAFVPYLSKPEEFCGYYEAYALIEEKGIGKISEAGTMITGEDYYAVFLSPNALGITDSAYDEAIASEMLSADDINALSPIIYLEYKCVRFVFTGDAGFSQEKVALYNCETGIIKQRLINAGKEDLRLEDLDFLKVSHHGANDACGRDFLNALKPKNAVISVGGNNYGHPKSETLFRIKDANENCNIYLTSEYGTVSVLVDDSGGITLKTDASAA